MEPQRQLREGILSNATFPSLMYSILSHRETGVLTLTGDTAEKSVYIQAGRPVFATSSDREDRLGQVLFRAGKVSLEGLVALDPEIVVVLSSAPLPERGALVFRVDHSQAHDIRAGWGFIRIRPYKGSQSLVSFGALVDIGDGVFVSIVRPAVRRDLLRIPYYLKNHLEGVGEQHARAVGVLGVTAPELVVALGADHLGRDRHGVLDVAEAVELLQRLPVRAEAGRG